MSILISFVRARATMRIHPKNSIAQRPNMLTVFVPYYRITQMKCKCVGNVLVYDINFAHRIFTTFSGNIRHSKADYLDYNNTSSSSYCGCYCCCFTVNITLNLMPLMVLTTDLTIKANENFSCECV